MDETITTLTAFNDISRSRDNIRRSDIIIKIKPREGGAKGTTGLVDNRLFTGENSLHALMDPQTTLWSMRYEKGLLPPVLRDQHFTSFDKLLTFTKTYFNNRNVDIVEIID